MTANAHHNSDDAVADVEKTVQPTVDSHPDTSGDFTNVESIVDTKVDGDAEGDAPRAPEEDAAPNKLDRVPSQAQKLGKKKITLIMVALCVRDHLGKCAVIRKLTMYATTVGAVPRCA